MRRRGTIFGHGANARALDWLLLTVGILLLGLVAVYGTVHGRDARISESISTGSGTPEESPPPARTPTPEVPLTSPEPQPAASEADPLR